MKLKLLLLFVPLLAFFGLFVSPSKALAAPHCSFPSGGGQIGISFKCGGFSSAAELQSYSINFHCVGKKSVLGTNTACDLLDPNRWDINFSLSGAATAQDPDGTYWTNITAQGIDPNVFYYEIQLKNSAGAIVQSSGTLGSGLNMPPLECDANGAKGVNTALGCIPTDFTGSGFITALLRLAIGLGSGIALLLVLYGIFIVTTSSGIPDKLNSGRDIISSAIAGLIFIILSIFLLNFVGVKILAIPGL